MRKMSHIQYFFGFILIHIVIAIPQLNLYYTDGINENDNVSQHNCLRIAVEEGNDVHLQSISFCMSELPSKFTSDNNNNTNFPVLTFDELSKQNITSEQLYIWSAPIDLIERYQFYLNQSIKSKEVFYNCTWPRFGSVCQYELNYDYSSNSSLHEIIKNFYYDHQDDHRTTITCYIHLECQHESVLSCLDWKEICDGKIDCPAGGLDEKYCWQLEINECKNDEYRCRNGQCIPQAFYQDYDSVCDCWDCSDVVDGYELVNIPCKPGGQPSIACDDLVCSSGLSEILFSRNCNDAMIEIVSLDKQNVVVNCWSAFKCLIKFTGSEDLFCHQICEGNTCLEIIQNTCNDMIYFPNFPILFSTIYFAYKKDELYQWTDNSTLPFYICYKTFEYDDAFVNLSKIFDNDMTCINSELVLSPDIFMLSPLKRIYVRSKSILRKLLQKYHLIYNYTTEICNRTNMYQCFDSSKCISLYRFMDLTDDCPSMDDENITATNNSYLIKYYKKTYFQCPTTGEYIPRTYIQNSNCECEYNNDNWCEDEHAYILYLHENIIFQHICDGFVDLYPIMVDERNETDETECEQWSCNNMYTRCNGVWNCLDGEDEVDCYSSPLLNCSRQHHLCVSILTKELICLPMEKTDDGHVDCLGGMDEITRCGKSQIIGHMRYLDPEFYCMNQTNEICIYGDRLCDGTWDCEYGDDEQFCITNNTLGYDDESLCNFRFDLNLSNAETFLCQYEQPHRIWGIIGFQLDSMTDKEIETPLISSSSLIETTFDTYRSRCHYGLDLQIWFNNLTTNTCLCPPSYYGAQCQYQNQRISLTIQFRALANSVQTLFAILISLIDDSDERIIHSSEQISFISKRDCNIKFDHYLLYSTRPKDVNQTYKIHIDVYEKISLTYRGSLLLPINFSFLPVHRLTFLLDIPRPYQPHLQTCSNKKCLHGKCIKYSNNPENTTFCKCDEQWSGKFCHIQHTCNCAPDSLCIGVTAANRSICVCPINKFGPRCYLFDRICQDNNENLTCLNKGRCISNIDHLTSKPSFICICLKGYSGERCEITDKNLILSFEKDLIVSQEIFIHFIDLISLRPYTNKPLRTTTFRTIPIRENSITIYWSQPFHLVFIEFSNKNYYLAIRQPFYNASLTINKTITSSDHCPHIKELFNETLIKFHLIRRIKYYHSPCQNQSLNLSCFYDEEQFCLCYHFNEKQRLSNCFQFDHNMTFDCRGQSECENNGQCLQDEIDCPTTSICVCPPCYYGGRCQFTTTQFGLSLDAILGYHISPHLHFQHQSSMIKMSLAVTILFLFVGYINGILSIITFKNKVILEVGCGIYLLVLSINVLLTMSLFGMKFFILLFTQMNMISNRVFLTIQCHSVDILLQISLWIFQWLNAFVAIERAITTVQGVNFIKRKSVKRAKLALMILFILSIATSIHDPIYRRLIDEENDNDDMKRIWCIVTYPFALKVYNSILNIIHFFGPVLINLISVIILIIKKARQLANARHHQDYKKILQEEFRQNKHLLIAPIVFVLLALPNLIITFVTKCMKSANDSWLFLVGYFISFIPLMFTFIVFVSTSTFYKEQYRKAIVAYRNNIRQRFHWTR